MTKEATKKTPKTVPETAVKPQKRLSYSRTTDSVLFIGVILILGLCIFIFKYWTQLGFNILFLGYWIFKEMRLATVFYGTVTRIILYPSALINKYLDHKIEGANKAYEKLEDITDVFERDSQKRQFLSSRKKVLLYSWFHLCFFTVNAVSVGYIFFQNFTKNRLEQELYTKFYLPQSFPINTLANIPLVGQVDLSIPNMKLNLYSAIGAGLVGLTQVIINKKVKRKELIKFLIFFPLGAYYLTCWVPSGFEFALIVFELLTIILIIIEKIGQSKAFRYLQKHT